MNWDRLRAPSRMPAALKRIHLLHEVGRLVTKEPQRTCCQLQEACHQLQEAYRQLQEAYHQFQGAYHHLLKVLLGLGYPARKCRVLHQSDPPKKKGCVMPTTLSFETFIFPLSRHLPSIIPLESVSSSTSPDFHHTKEVCVKPTVPPH